jgi:predicted deacetylase
MGQYILRLDDASPMHHRDNWYRMEELLDRYRIKPMVGIIPDNQDASFAGYETDVDFWRKALNWKDKGWAVAMHGYQHVYVTKQGGLNPVQQRSEFAGLPLAEQKLKIASGVAIMREHGINPRIFIAPSHTFDANTLIALKEASDIRIISDTIAREIYYDKGFCFIPQQSGRVRRLPFITVTFCYHPNDMTDPDFVQLERFIEVNQDRFVSVRERKLKKRKLDYYDWVLRKIYFYRRSGKR